MIIHVECLPDETLVRKLGFTKKQVKHHNGKSRVFAAMKDSHGHVGLVDEDPFAQTTTYEDNLVEVEDSYGVMVKRDTKRDHHFCILKVKLEDWILSACKASKISAKEFGLPERPNDLHDVINNRLMAFEKLLDELLKAKNTHLLKLSECLHNKPSK